MKTERPPGLGRLILVSLVGCSLGVGSVARAEDRTFPAGSLVIPMDLAYQDHGIFQAYGLLFQLLRHGIPVVWAINPNKTWHAAPCNTAGDLCAWDCAVEGSGAKCPYPTASPDFYAAAEVVWDGETQAAAGTAIPNHGYRGGPFVIEVAHREAALAVINAWNDQSQWAAKPWAKRTVFNVVTVHKTTAPVVAAVAKEMFAAPTIAVFSDGNEQIATSYLRAAGIPQSSGAEFPAAKCEASNCGPGTANPDMLTVPSIMGPMGTCNAMNLNHKNGALFTADGLPAYCQIMSMHWDVNDREKVQCDGAACPATQAACAGKAITYHGHEVVAEVRSFLQYPVHFFAECQAVNAYENTTPISAWPFLDDEGRDGHFLTTRGTPPPCPCTAQGLSCVSGGCGGADCCLPTNAKEQGAGFLIASQPASESIQVLRPVVPYNQLDGPFQTVGGSEPAYNLSKALGTQYKNDREVTFITGANGPGNQDVWMTGYADGVCDIGFEGEFAVGGGGNDCGKGKVSYLGGHSYKAAVPLSANADGQGTRLFLNALFEADCVTKAGQPQLALSLTGDLLVPAQSLPVERSYQVAYSNQGAGAALDSVLALGVPADVAIAAAPSGNLAPNDVTWSLGNIGGVPARAGDPSSAGTRSATLRFSSFGEKQVTVGLTYRVGATTLVATPRTYSLRVALDTDGDGIPDDVDPDPTHPNAADAGTSTTTDGGMAGAARVSGCGCQAGLAGDAWLAALAVHGLGALQKRRATKRGPVKAQPSR
jgi:hypothetical protein